MADNINVEALKEGIALLNKAVGMGGFAGRSSAMKDYKNNNVTSGGGDVDFAKMKNILKNNNDIMTQFAASLKDVAKRGTELQGIYKRLEESSRTYNDVQRKATLAVADQLKSQKTMVADLEKVSDTLKNARNSLKNSTKAFSDMDKAQQVLKARLRERLDIETKYNADKKKLEDDIAKKRSQKKSTAQGKSDLDALTKSYQEDVKALDENIKENQEKFSKLSDASDEVINNFLKLNEITGTLTKDQVDQLKNFKNMSEQQRKDSGVYGTVADSVKGLGEGTDEAAKLIVSNSKSAGEGFMKAGKAALNFGKALLSIIPGLYEGMMAKYKYNVSSSGYIEAGLRGMSEQERAQLIGENRAGLRGLGGGDENAGFTNSKALQNTAHLFGVTGAEALKKALEYQQTSMGFGISSSNVQGQQLQISTMRAMAKQVGVTDDQLKDFYDSLVDSGQAAAMVANAQGKTEDERQKSVNQEIDQRVALNRQLGINLDMLKQQAQDSINARYAGLAQSIKGQVGAKLLVNQYNQSNPGAQLSADDTSFLQRIDATGGPGNATADDSARYNKLMEKISSARNAQQTADQRKASSGGGMGAYQGDLVNNQILQTFIPNLQDRDVQYSKAAQQAKSQGPNVVQGSFSDVLKQATDDMGGPKGFNAQIIAATEALEGFNKSPIGGKGGFAAYIGKAISGYVGGKVLEKGAGYIAKQLGTDSIIGRTAGTAAETVASEGVGGLGLNLLKGGGKLLGKVAAPISAMMGSWDAYKDTTNGNFDKFQNSLGIKGGSVGADTGAQALNVFNHIGNTLTLGAAGWLGDKLGSLENFGSYNPTKSTPYVPMKQVMADLPSLTKDAQSGTPLSDLANKYASDPTVELEAKKRGETVEKLLADIAKYSKVSADADKQQSEANQTQQQAAQTGSTYSMYKAHLSDAINGIKQ
jgi:hypothetical protein